LLLPEVANLAPDHQIVIPPKLTVDRPLFLVAGTNQACPRVWTSPGEFAVSPWCFPIIPR
jgi:hypothetical protein